MDNYIIRIYRRGKNDPRILIGVVEEVGVEGKEAFTTLEELWEILTKYRERNNKDNKKGIGH